MLKKNRGSPRPTSASKVNESSDFQRLHSDSDPEFASIEIEADDIPDVIRPLPENKNLLNSYTTPLSLMLQEI